MRLLSQNISWGLDIFFLHNVSQYLAEKESEKNQASRIRVTLLGYGSFVWVINSDEMKNVLYHLTTYWENPLWC